ncbi:hypothetical protein [Vogesella sp. XCS3]|uniref:hypothetical protein n=1 Tax=Vogesella sp. XCS3 TaxID=2877939 RepID=UPI001D09FC57|nr:hypothetical protein [Vogesella sp. XCS3]UDM18317.1 hypothetical protein LCH97_06545 [Vogesella sp. XCS3]
MFSALRSMANRADYAVRHSRNLSDAEFEEAKKLHDNPSRVIHEEIGRVSNVSCFLVEEHKFCMSSKKYVEDLLNIDIENSSTQQLSTVAKNIDQMMRDLDGLKKTIKEFELFKANDANIRLLPFLL